VVATLLCVNDRLERNKGRVMEEKGTGNARQARLPLFREQLLLENVVNRPPRKLKVGDIDALLRFEEGDCLVGGDVDEAGVHAGKN
jgi:predicted MarR family transcription regulator